MSNTNHQLIAKLRVVLIRQRYSSVVAGNHCAYEQPSCYRTLWWMRCTYVSLCPTTFARRRDYIIRLTRAQFGDDVGSLFRALTGLCANTSLEKGTKLLAW